MNYREGGISGQALPLPDRVPLAGAEDFPAFMCRRPKHQKPGMILPVGGPAGRAMVPAVASRKMPLDRIIRD